MPDRGLESGSVVRRRRVTTLDTSRTVSRGRRRFKLSTKSTRWPAAANPWAMCCLLVQRGECQVAVETSTKSTGSHPFAGKLTNQAYLEDVWTLGDDRPELNTTC